MRKALVKVHDIKAGILTELGENPISSPYCFEYFEGYKGVPVSLTMPVAGKKYDFDKFPAYFDGVLPEGGKLEGLLRIRKIDRHDYFSQLLVVGNDLVGAVTVIEL